MTQSVNRLCSPPPPKPRLSTVLGYFNVIRSRLSAEGCVTLLLWAILPFTARMYSFPKQPLLCLLVITDVCIALVVCSGRPLATWDLKHCSHFKCLQWGRHSFVFDFCLKFVQSEMKYPHCLRMTPQDRHTGTVYTWKDTINGLAAVGKWSLRAACFNDKYQ
jgi:hypothetical protein